MKRFQIGIRRFNVLGEPMVLDAISVDYATLRTLIHSFWSESDLKEFDHEAMFVPAGGPAFEDWIWYRDRRGLYGLEQITVIWPAKYKFQKAAK